MDYMIWVESNGKWTATLNGPDGKCDAGSIGIRGYASRAAAKAAIEAGEVDAWVIARAVMQNEWYDRNRYRKMGLPGRVWEMSIEAVRERLAETD